MELHLTAHGRNVDLRHELASEFDVERESPFRDHPLLSANAKKMLESFQSEKWQQRFRLADRIESGHATESEAEVDALYTAFPEMLNEIIDLFNMVSRRDELIAKLPTGA